MESKDNHKESRFTKGFGSERRFIEVLVWVVGSFCFYWTLAIEAGARSFNTKPAMLPLVGECTMMEVLVLGTTWVLSFALLFLHVLYWEYQRISRRRADPPYHLPAIAVAQRIPQTYRKIASSVLVVAVLVVPSIGYLDLVFQLHQ